MHVLDVQYLSAKAEMRLLNETLMARIKTLEQELSICQPGEAFQDAEMVRGLRRDSKGIVTLPWAPKTLEHGLWLILAPVRSSRL